MHEVVQNMTIKSLLEKYKEQNAAIAAMVARGDTSNDLAWQLMEKLNSDLLSATR
jgi:hypothetical protein